LRILKKHPILFLPEPLVGNRHSVHGYSQGAIRKKITLNELFVVMDRHIQNGAGVFLTAADKDNYAYLLLKDQIRCAVNGILQGDRATARAMSKNVFSKASCALCIGKAGRSIIFGIGAASWALSFLALPEPLRMALFKIRFDYLRP
jgi:hypothetical protein